VGTERWKFYARIAYEDFRFETLNRLLAESCQKLIVFKFNNKTIALYLRGSYLIGDTNAQVASFLFLPSESQKFIPTDHILTLKENSLQIYRGTVGATFVKFWKDQDTGVKCASIDMTRFGSLSAPPGSLNRQTFEAIEFYVQNPDVPLEYDIFPAGYL
jgi:hypothetical protein